MLNNKLLGKCTSGQVPGIKIEPVRRTSHVLDNQSPQEIGVVGLNPGVPGPLLTVQVKGPIYRSVLIANEEDGI